MARLEDSLFLRACRGLSVSRTPVWVMRQAGRYLPEYQKVRSQTTFLGLCKTPELAVEVTIQPIRRYQMDAAIIFSDILIPVEAMGVPLEFDEGPKILKRIPTEADIQELRVPDPKKHMSFVLEAVSGFVHQMPEVPLIGFAGAPFTLLCYLVEGGPLRDFSTTKTFLYQHPKAARLLLQKLTQTVTEHLLAQVDAGASAVQIFDSWAGALSKEDYLRFALPYTIQIVDELKKTVAPVIVFAKGAHASLEELSECGADVLGIDWTMPLDEATQRTKNKVVLQGNLDPCVLLGPKEHIEQQVQRVLTEAKDLRGHIFNLGHGVLKMTDPEHVQTMVDAVKRLSSLV